MENVYGGQTGNVILTRLFRKAELSWAVFAFSGAVSPIVDLMFISLFIGSEGVTVMGYVSPLIMLSALVGSYIICGARNEVSTLLGAGKIDEANSVFSASVFLGGGLSLITAVAVGIFCSGVSVILGVRDPQILEMTKLYISGNIIGLPFFSLIQILRAYLQMEGQYHRVSMISILITVIDIAADAFVVFVLHGGIFGLALATSVGYIIPFFVGAEFFMRKKHNSVFRLSHKGLNLKICCKIMHLGSPAAVIKGSNAVGGILINNMLTALNIRYLVAAYGVFAQITVFVSSSWYAPADTLHAFAGIFIGEEDRNSLKEVQKISLLHALLWTSIVTALMFVFAVPLTWIFLKSNDPEALRMSVECIRVSCFSLPFHAIVYNFNNYLMAVKRLRFCNFYSFLIECGNIVPITFLMLQLINYPGAWVSKVVNMLLLSAIAWFYISKNNVEGGGYRDKMLLLPDSFGFSSYYEISISANSTDEIIDLSRVAVSFALEHGADMKRAKTFGLVTEELATVIRGHGFNDGKPHNINARLMAKGEELIIRMRDDCEPFNMIEYYKKVRDDLENGVGMSIIMKQSKDVQHTNTLGTNNLIVRL